MDQIAAAKLGQSIYAAFAHLRAKTEPQKAECVFTEDVSATGD